MADESPRRYRVYVSKSGKLFIEGSFDSEGDAIGYANSIKDHYPVVCVRSVFRPAGSTGELEEDVLVLRGGQEVPLRAASDAAPVRTKAAPAKPSNRLLVNSVTALLLLAIALVVVHNAVLPLWGRP